MTEKKDKKRALSSTQVRFNSEKKKKRLHCVETP